MNMLLSFLKRKKERKKMKMCKCILNDKNAKICKNCEHYRSWIDNDEILHDFWCFLHHFTSPPWMTCELCKIKT